MPSVQPKSSRYATLHAFATIVARRLCIHCRARVPLRSDEITHWHVKDGARKGCAASVVWFTLGEQDEDA